MWPWGDCWLGWLRAVRDHWDKLGRIDGDKEDGIKAGAGDSVGFKDTEGISLIAGAAERRQ